MSYAAAAVGRLPIAISFLAIVGDHVSHSCKIIDTAKDFPQLDFTVPNDTTYWVWDDVMEQKYWKRLKKWKQMPLKTAWKQDLSRWGYRDIKIRSDALGNGLETEEYRVLDAIKGGR
ncbi:hypothetical protein GE061_018462 [Apolygus lucorum]|uniref:Uncharacterized protein n=1 Tax=Apolygus lucorum TaxID=248454 RepID=A0A8S9XDZ4_APOLU|nr:hypothetical protein GE061_018462 [Apolygus lucorum]